MTTDTDWRIERALDRCARLFPRRYRDAAADIPAVVDWAAHYRRDPDGCPSLLILGVTGVGKTHQAYGAIRAAVSVTRAVDWQACTAADLYAGLRPSGADGSGLTYAKAVACPLLLVDDLGAAKVTEWTEETTYRLIDARYRDCRPTVFTSNLGAGQLGAQLGDRVASRLTEMCTRVVIEGIDRRRTAA